LTYQKRLYLLIVVDSLIVFTSVFLSHWFLNPELIRGLPSVLIPSSLTLLITHHIFSYRYKLYQKAWEYASVGELFHIFKSVTFSVLITSISQKLINGDIYFRILALTWMLHILLIGGSRFCWRLFRDQNIINGSTGKNTLIIGAGAAGTMVVRQLLQSKDTELKPVAFMDDDESKYKLEILGIPVLGNTNQIKEIVDDNNIEHIIIAIPSLDRKSLNVIFEKCTQTKVKTQIVPMLEDIVQGKVSINEFKDVQVEDLLGRKPVQLDDKGIVESISGRTVLVTGAGGSIGSEICRQILKYSPSQIVLLGHGENSIYSIEMELRSKYGNSLDIVTEIADIQDRHKLFEIMQKHRPYIVYHAAAHKHVPLMERNPEEAVKNNIIGTRNVAEAADTFNVNTFVMISTDKAVNPTSVMGATKRIAEMIVQHMDSISNTRFVAVRFGNVLGSRGSVIPLFKKQIQAGGPVTVTHPDMERFFMTIPEASRLVIQAGALAKGGEIFVLDMGEPVKIVDLAKNLITLSGYDIEEIGITFSGIRPGEKMYEELLNDGEVSEEQVYEKIYVGRSNKIDRKGIESLIETFLQLERNQLVSEIFKLAKKEHHIEPKFEVSK